MAHFINTCAHRMGDFYTPRSCHLNYPLSRHNIGAAGQPACPSNFLFALHCDYPVTTPVFPYSQKKGDKLPLRLMPGQQKPGCGRTLSGHLVHTLNDGAIGGTAAFANRQETIALPCTMQLMHKRRHEFCAGSTQGVTQSLRASIDI